MKKMALLLLCLFLVGCTGTLHSINGRFQPPPDVQDNWDEKMCWQFVSPLSRGASVGGLVTGSGLMVLAGMTLDVTSTKNLCDLTLNEMLSIGYLKLFSQTENSLIVERTDISYVPMPSPRLYFSKYYLLGDIMGVHVTVWERVRENNTERGYEIYNELQVQFNNLKLVKENVSEEEALTKHRRWITALAEGTTGPQWRPVQSAPTVTKAVPGEPIAGQ